MDLGQTVEDQRDRNFRRTRNGLVLKHVSSLSIGEIQSQIDRSDYLVKLDKGLLGAQFLLCNINHHCHLSLGTATLMDGALG